MGPAMLSDRWRGSVEEREVERFLDGCSALLCCGGPGQLDGFSADSVVFIVDFELGARCIVHCACCGKYL